MIQTNVTPLYTEIYSVGGNFITESFPTNFHTFSTRKILIKSDDISRYKEITAAQRAALEASDAAWTRPPRSFIVLWNEACGVWGKYNEATGFFELNGLTDITYEEAVVILLNYQDGDNQQSRLAYPKRKYRTNIPPFTYALADFTMFAFGNTSVEVLNLGGAIMAQSNALERFATSATSLREILGVNLQGTTLSKNTEIMFRGCKELRYVEIKWLSSDISFQYSPLLESRTFEYILNNRGLSQNTIIVHPDVYAKLTDPDNEEWFPLLAQAAEKNIQFATT